MLRMGVSNIAKVIVTYSLINEIQNVLDDINIQHVK